MARIGVGRESRAEGDAIRAGAASGGITRDGPGDKFRGEG